MPERPLRQRRRDLPGGGQHAGPGRCQDQAEAETKGSYFPKILARQTSFYMLGWTPSTYDAHNALFNLMATPGAGRPGPVQPRQLQQQGSRRADVKVAPRPTGKKRQQMIARAFKLHKDDFGHIPLHQQALAWGIAQE